MKLTKLQLNVLSRVKREVGSEDWCREPCLDAFIPGIIFRDGMTDRVIKELGVRRSASIIAVNSFFKSLSIAS